MTWQILQGDALAILQTMPDASFDGVLCDPPYGLSFMGKTWDHGVPSAEVWREVLRVLKPGAFLLAFGGTRTFHRLTCAIEDAGFEIRDCAMWLYGSGFPKSMDISKALDKAAGAEREVVGIRQVSRDLQRNGIKGDMAVSVGGVQSAQIPVTAPATDAARTWEGYGTALKPAWEPCIVAMKPLDGTFAENALRHGVAGLNIEAGRIDGPKGVPASPSNAGVHGWNTGDWERKQHQNGRWPANLILDEISAAMMPEVGAAPGTYETSDRGDADARCYDGGWSGKIRNGHKSPRGSASRFFYCAKASRRERDAGLEGFGKKALNWSSGEANPGSFQGEGTDRTAKNFHPCLKPLDLNRYLASLILPPKRDTPRRILVPFSGSGSEMIGALLAGWDEAVGIEREADYCAIAEARLAHWTQPEAWNKAVESTSAHLNLLKGLPLFQEGI